MKKKNTKKGRCAAPSVGKLIYNYIDKVLTSNQRERFEAHLRRCTECQEELHFWRTARKILTRNPDIFGPKR